MGVTVCEPLAVKDPLQLPDAVQPDAFTDDQLIVVGLFTATEAAASVSEGAPGGTRVMAASACTKPAPELKL